MPTKAASGRTCAYKAESEDVVGQQCKGFTLQPLKSQSWQVRMTFGQAQDACRKHPECTGIQWHKRRGGAPRTEGSYLLCRSTKLVVDANWVFIPATCKGARSLPFRPFFVQRGEKSTLCT